MSAVIPPWAPGWVDDETLPAYLQTIGAAMDRGEYEARASGDAGALAEIAAAREAMFSGFKQVFADTMGYAFGDEQ